MWIKAPAKINLVLKVLGKRIDGYHNILTVMQKITLYDSVWIELIRKGIVIGCDNSTLSKGKDNLAYKAAEAFFRGTGCNGGARIIIKKRIPVGAGLGGGSSDAAAVLKGLERLLKTGISLEGLSKLGESIGADVPFFINSAPSAVAEGKGEILTPVSLPVRWFVIVYPGIEISTKWAYSKVRFNLTESHKENKIYFLNNVYERLFNDLETVSMKKYPELNEIKTRLIDRGAADARMSGSGSSVFGVFPDMGTAKKAVKELQKLYWTKMVTCI
ncbi:MAG TPA: 4-(cytidine 5'-diphospho)-2-C-methyl-D-erythritol kinase [bacterium]